MISEGSCDTEVMKLKLQLCQNRKKKILFSNTMKHKTLIFR